MRVLNKYFLTEKGNLGFCLKALLKYKLYFTKLSCFKCTIQLNKFTKLCTHHHSPILELFFHPQKTPLPSIPFPPLVQGNHWFIFHLCRFVERELSYNKIFIAYRALAVSSSTNNVQVHVWERITSLLAAEVLKYELFSLDENNTLQKGAWREELVVSKSHRIVGDGSEGRLQRSKFQEAV